jgi:MoxR-like ATPase
MHPVTRKLPVLIRSLEAGLLERDVAVRLGLLAVLAGEHVLLLGPPGSAKSALARRLHQALSDGRYFERLLTRFSTPEELFGPLSLKALEDDRYERLVEGYLPTAGVAFLDEVFKANSAILNALLGLLNERMFDNGRERLHAPLVSVVGASNEVPADEALQAFFDRFLLRVPVAPVSDAGFADLLTLRDERAAVAEPVTTAERSAVLLAADAVTMSQAALQALAALRAWLGEQALAQPSDRRWRQLVRLLRVAAAAEGRIEVDELDLWLVPYVVAAAPEHLPRVAQWFAQACAQAPAHEESTLQWIERAVQAFDQQLDIEVQAPADNNDASAEDAGKLATARNLGAANDASGDPLASMRIVSHLLQERQSKRYGRLHIDTRVAQVQEVAARVQLHINALAQTESALAARLAQRLWQPPSLAAQLLAGPRATLAELRSQLARLDDCAQGFAALPLDVASAAPAPAAVAL